MDGDPDTTKYTAFESSMSPYWQGNGRTVPKCYHSEHLPTVWIQEEEGQRERLFERIPIPTARYYTNVPGWKQL